MFLNLEAVALLTTSKEIDSGMLERFDKQFQTMQPNCLNCIIFINNIFHKKQLLTCVPNMSRIFKSIEVIYVNIATSDDIYKFSRENLPSIPELGLIAGPNIMFFSAIEYCYKYENTLVLETDCILKSDVFEILEKYVQTAGHFYVSGAIYCGSVPMRGDHRFFTHLNGVAIYKTGDPGFQDFMAKVYNYIIAAVKNGDIVMPYDCAISLYVSNMFSVPETVIRGKILYSKLIHNNLIVNFSPGNDKHISMQYIEDNFPGNVIVHKKT